jgi:hypothetical protein
LRLEQQATEEYEEGKFRSQDEGDRRGIYTHYPLEFQDTKMPQAL